MQVYVCAAAQSGDHHPGNPKGRSSWGRSMIVDPWGAVVASAGGSADCWEGDASGEGEGVCYAWYEPDVVQAVREMIPVWVSG